MRIDHAHHPCFPPNWPDFNLRYCRLVVGFDNHMSVTGHFSTLCLIDDAVSATANNKPKFTIMAGISFRVICGSALEQIKPWHSNKVRNVTSSADCPHWPKKTHKEQDQSIQCQPPMYSISKLSWGTPYVSMPINVLLLHLQHNSTHLPDPISFIS